MVSDGSGFLSILFFMPFFSSYTPERNLLHSSCQNTFSGLTLRLLMSYVYMELLVKSEMLTSYMYMDLRLATLKQSLSICCTIFQH